MTPPSINRIWRHIPLLFIVLASIVGYFLLRDHISIENLQRNQELLLNWRDHHYLLLSISFVLIYVTIVAFSLPGAAVASITGGFLFGLGMGTLLNVAAATMGATVIFLAVRMGLGQAITKRMETSEGTIKKIKSGLQDNEISVLFLLRLVPVVPFFVANILPALVGVKLRNYVFTTMFGIIPGALVFTSIGSGLGELFALGQKPDLSLLWDPIILGPLLGLSALAALPILLKHIHTRRGI